MNHILFIGGANTVGGQVPSQLVSAGAQVRAFARKPDAARFPAQVEVVRGDLAIARPSTAAARSLGMPVSRNPLGKVISQFVFIRLWSSCSSSFTATSAFF
jgi:hypothetical protein